MSLFLRHFICCKEIQLSDTNLFNAKEIFEYFSSSEYPAVFHFELVMGVYFLEGNTEYNLDVKAFLNDEIVLHMAGGPVKTDRTKEIMNFMFQKVIFEAEKPGIIRFDISVNGDLINQQFMLAEKEGE